LKQVVTESDVPHKRERLKILLVICLIAATCGNRSARGAGQPATPETLLRAFKSTLEGSDRWLSSARRRELVSRLASGVSSPKDSNDARDLAERDLFTFFEILERGVESLEASERERFAALKVAALRDFGQKLDQSERTVHRAEQRAARTDSQLCAPLEIHTGTASPVLGFSRQGELLTQDETFSVSQRYRAWSMESGARLRDVSNGPPGLRWGREQVYSPDGNWRVTNGLHGIQVSRRAGSKFVAHRTIPDVGMASAIGFSQDSSKFAFVIDRDEVYLLETQGTAAWKKPLPFPQEIHKPSMFDLSPDGKFLVASDGEIVTVRTQAGKVIKTFPFKSDFVQALRFVDADRFVIGGEDGSLRVVAFASKSPFSPPLGAHSATVGALEIFNHGKNALSSARDGTVAITNLATGVVMRLKDPSPVGPREYDEPVAVDLEHGLIAAGAARGRTRVWKIRDLRESGELSWELLDTR
jgi:hypothetical protein